MDKLKYFSINLGICYMLVMILFLITSCIFAYTSINDNFLDMFVYTIIGISVVVTSTMLSRKIKEKGILYGGLFGLLVMLNIYLFSLLFLNGIYFTTITGILFLIAIVSGAIGGIIGVNI